MPVGSRQGTEGTERTRDKHLVKQKASELPHGTACCLECLEWDNNSGCLKNPGVLDQVIGANQDRALIKKEPTHTP